jgi:hypothetical protein
VHLQPPRGRTRIVLERYSPYFEQPDLGFPERWPAALYGHVYDLAADELANLVYQFDTVPRGIGEAYEATVLDAVKRWQDAYPESSLYYSHTDDGALTIFDRRVGWEARDVHLAAGAESVAYEMLRAPLATSALIKGLRKSDVRFEERQVEAWVGLWEEAGFVFREDDRMIALATRRPSLKSGAGVADDALFA